MAVEAMAASAALNPVSTDPLIHILYIVVVVILESCEKKAVRVSN